MRPIARELHGADFTGLNSRLRRLIERQQQGIRVSPVIREPMSVAAPSSSLSISPWAAPLNAVAAEKPTAVGNLRRGWRSRRG